LLKKAISVILFILLIVGSPGFSFASAPVYRTIDGSGNNESHTSWGTPGQQLFRVAPVGYQDGISVPRGGLDPSTLPSARAISNIVVAQSGSSPNPQGASDMFWQWGQIMDHDLDLTLPASEPFNILIPLGDPIFDPTNSGTQIMAFTRSSFDSLSSPRQQTNVVTAFIDGSMVYGSDPTRQDFLRDHAHPGKLKLDSNGLLPLNDAMPPLPNGNGPPTNLPSEMFMAGDVRVNEQVGLTVIHTLLVREHNWLVDQLVAQGVTGDEELYQQAKAILEGEIQHITYNEFLPLLLGTDPSYTIAPYSGYNPAVNPQVSNEFSTAGFRVGHTLLSSSLERFEEDGTVSPGGHLSLRNSFFNPQIVKDDGIERILRGLAVGKSEKIDNFVIDDVRNFLFGEPAPVGGFDLPSLNIQRGRDHGLPSYNIVRSAYGLPTVDSFFDITYETDIDLANKLKTAYGVNVDGSDNVNAVDVWVGGISEPPVPGGMVGPTFAKILKDQFERVRDGDRFWYQNRNDLSDFQNQMIENTRLSDIILRNTDIDSIQQNVFLAMDRTDNDLDNDGTPDATDTDDDGDGISDTIDTMPTVYSPSFSDVFLGGTTYGHIENRGGKAVTIIDEPDPAGVRVSAVGGGAPATVSSCGFEGTISFDSGDMAVITCGSVTIQVLSGSVDISYMMGGSTVTAEMFSGTIMINPDPGSVSITNLSGDTTIMVMIDGIQTEIGPGVTYEFPVQPDNSQVIGGEIIPLDTAALLLAGAQTSAVWMVPLLFALVGTAIIYIKKKRN